MTPKGIALDGTVCIFFSILDEACNGRIFVHTPLTAYLFILFQRRSRSFPCRSTPPAAFVCISGARHIKSSRYNTVQSSVMLHGACYRPPRHAEDGAGPKRARGKAEGERGPECTVR